MLLSAHIVTIKYVARYITLLFQKAMLICNVLLGVNLVANFVM